MSVSTSILDLPTDPVGNGTSSNNISLTASENLANTPINNKPLNLSVASTSLDQTTISQIVNGLQQASYSGATQLPSRDIPMNTSEHNIDPQIQPNYIPQPKNNSDYIKNYEETSNIINDFNKSNQKQKSLDDIYNEIQMPLLLTVLYFLFQLPFFRNFLFKYLPFLFSNDGNFNINGFIFTSIFFGSIFYLLNKIITYFGTF